MPVERALAHAGGGTSHSKGVKINSEKGRAGKRGGSTPKKKNNKIIKKPLGHPKAMPEKTFLPDL